MRPLTFCRHAARALAGAAAGDALGQGIDIATGLQKKFSWSEVAVSAVSAGVTDGLGGYSPGASFATRAVAGAAAYVAASATEAALGDGSFGHDLEAGRPGLAASTAASAALGPIDNAIGATGHAATSPLAEVGSALSGAAGAVAGAATQSALTGASFGRTLEDQLPEAVGQTVGNTIGGNIEQSQQQQTLAQASENSAGETLQNITPVTAIGADIVPAQPIDLTGFVPAGSPDSPGAGIVLDGGSAGGYSGAAITPSASLPAGAQILVAGPLAEANVNSANAIVPDGNYGGSLQINSAGPISYVDAGNSANNQIYRSYFNTQTGDALGTFPVVVNGAPVTLSDGSTVEYDPPAASQADPGVTHTIYGDIPNMTPQEANNLTQQQQAFSNNGYDYITNNQGFATVGFSVPGVKYIPVVGPVLSRYTVIAFSVTETGHLYVSPGFSTGLLPVTAVIGAAGNADSYLSGVSYGFAAGPGLGLNLPAKPSAVLFGLDTLSTGYGIRVPLPSIHK